MLKNKKGAVSESITDAIAYLFFILIIVLFFFLFKFGSTDLTVKITGEVGEANANNILLGYLNYPVKVDLSKLKMGEREQGMTMADLIAIYHPIQNIEEGEKIKEIIQEETQEFITNYKNLKIELFISPIIKNSKIHKVVECKNPSYNPDFPTLIKDVRIAYALIPAHNKDGIKVKVIVSDQHAAISEFIKEAKEGDLD